MGRSGRVWVRVVLAALVAVALVLPPSTAAATGTAEWTWPLRPPPSVVREAALPTSPWLPGHRGVDLAAAPGAPVLAPADGVVVFAGAVAGRGVLVLAHPGGLRSSVEPVAGLLPVGATVHRGDRVAELTGVPGHCWPTTCLHWGVRRGTAYLDPLTLLRAREPPVLLPQPASRSLVRSCTTALVCIWQMRDSVTPRMRPISARVRPS